MTHHAKWTAPEIDRLRTLRQQGMMAREIAPMLNRSVNAVANAFKRVARLEPPPANVLTHEEKAVYDAICKAADAGTKRPTNRELARMLRRCNETARKHIDTLVRYGRIELRRRGSQSAIRIVASGNKTAGFDEFGKPPVRGEVVAAVVAVETPPRVMRDPCPWCNTRMDAPEEFCCVRGRQLRKLVA